MGFELLTFSEWQTFKVLDQRQPFLSFYTCAGIVHFGYSFFRQQRNNLRKVTVGEAYHTVCR